jgi:lia operon protein LiaG
LVTRIDSFCYDRWNDFGAEERGGELKSRRIIGTVLLLIGMLIITFNLIREGKGREPKEVRLSLSEQIRTVSVNVSNMNIRIIPEAREDVEVFLHGSGRMSVKSTDSGIEVNAWRNRLALFPLDCTLVVRLPEAYPNNLSLTLSDGDVFLSGHSGIRAAPFSLKELTINVQPGKAELQDMEAEELSFKASAGALRGESINVSRGRVEMNTGSMKLIGYRGNLDARINNGDIDASDVQVDTGVIAMQRGSVSMEQYTGKLSVNVAEAGEIRAAHVSTVEGSFVNKNGEIHLDHYSGKLHTDLQAGEVKVGFSRLTDAADVRVGKGRAELNLPIETEIRLQAAVELGDIKNEYAFDRIEFKTEKELQAVRGAGSVPVNVHVSAGEITLD